MPLRLIWWNAQDFAHFDASRQGERQWPDSQESFDAKAVLLANVLKGQLDGQPVIIALGETTSKALETLRTSLLPTYNVFSLDLLERSDMHVGFIYPKSPSYVVQPPFVPEYVPQGTRPMAVLDVIDGAHRIRIVACHWTARFRDTSAKTRSETARALSRYVFDYLTAAATDEERHIVLIGDFNEEPAGLLEADLYAVRDRYHAQRKHKSDQPIKRRYLYNVSWRLLGERLLPTDGPHQAAGTYYWPSEKAWRTFDQIVIDGSLAGTTYPMLDESHTKVIIHPESFRAGPTPRKFWWDGTAATGGVSDHLPVVTLLRLGDTSV